MAPSSTRATRSRYSSPQQTPNGTTPSESSKGHGPASTTAKNTPSAAADDQRKTLLQRWLEPPLNSKASYQDAGLVRHGVVENMAPLGTMPKVGIFKKAAPPAPPPLPPTEKPPVKIILKRHKAATPTPAPTPVLPPPAPEEDETEEEEDEMVDDAGDEDDGEEDEIAAPQFRRHSLPSHDLDDEWAPGKASQKGFSRRSMSRTSGRLGSMSSSSFQQVTPSAASRFAALKKRTDEVIERAVDEALSSYRYPTAWALRTLYDENCEDLQFLVMIDKIFFQTAEREDLEKFAQLMIPKKQEGKKDNKACYYFVPPSTNSRFTPRKPKPAPYGHLIKVDLSFLQEGIDPAPKQEPQTEAVTEREPELEREPVHEPEPELNPQPEREATPTPAPVSASASRRERKRSLPQDEEQTVREAHTRKKRRSNRHSESTSKMSANGVNGKVKTDSPSKRRTRANSISSSSSLSSARSMTPPDGIREEDDETEVPDAPTSRTSPAAESTSNTAALAAPQPITRRRRSAAPRKSGNGTTSAAQPASVPGTKSKRPTPTPSITSQLTTTAAAQQPAPEQPYDMPAVVDAPLVPNSNAKKGGKAGNNGVVFPSKVGTIDESDERLRLRQNARKLVIKVQEETPVSNIRNAQHNEAPSSGLEESSTPAPYSSRTRTSLPASRPAPTASNARSTRSSRKRSHDEIEEQASPTTVNFAASEAVPSTAANSRAGTPALRAPKRPRTGLRVKNSPMKKKSGTSAGIPRASGERNSPGALANKEDDNDDYCASCGGNGELICCDGCTRSFHFACVDPPIGQDSMPVEWFCNVCRLSRDPAAFPAHDGGFSSLLESLDGRNSSAFRLPGDVRELFDNVRTGIDGEYEDLVGIPKPTRKKKSDEDQVPDLFRVRDAEGNPVICHSCQKASNNNRGIIPCGFCGLSWHLDCLDPPLARPPVLRTWKCPCHVDDLLAKIPGALGPAHRFRKIKGAPPIKPAFARGYANNGWIDVELDNSEDESGWKDVETYGRTVRLPEKGIKLDFLSRARENRKGKPIPPLMPATPAVAPQPTQPVLDKRTLEQQQAAYNLAQLSGQGNFKIDMLIDSLLAGADQSVISLIARGDAEHLSAGQQLNNTDQQSLRAVLAQLEQTGERIRQLLNPATPDRPSPQAAISTSGATQEQLARVPSLTHSQTTNAESENPITNLDLVVKENLPSPAATDDVPPINQMDEDSGHQASLVPDDGQAAEEDKTDDMPATPADNKVIDGDDALAVKKPQGEKTAVKVDDGDMDLD
ncbi:hypothetical protein B0H67DRAFT_269147 [Lasiosphaeris hirsuta]|uniref:PHD-type domain-containing protein n=1 Tax=Lasiosphaeris hirsuta TaxID=260670 RepID=A0AA40A865_9PEZI|nr:hypothetical protein B0H67DRAFT_269147 [Lasiosphaeris hirsuta]